MFIRIIEQQSAKSALEAAAKSVSPVPYKRAAVTYDDYIVQADRFEDRAEILYACSFDGREFAVLKDNAAVIDAMPHTFGGWPWKEIPGIDNGTTITPDSDIPDGEGSKDGDA